MVVDAFIERDVHALIRSVQIERRVHAVFIVRRIGPDEQ
jgi:hypothetical protein